MGIYGHMQPYIHIIECIYLQKYIYLYIYAFYTTCMYIYLCLYALTYSYICIYRCFWLAFGLILYHCSAQQGESPTTPRELRKTAKYKRNIGQTLQQLASALHPRLKDNRRCRKECKAIAKKSNIYANMLKKISLLFKS